MDKARIRSFADKVYGDMAGAVTMGMAYVGVATGLFRAMAGQGPMTIDAVTAAAKLDRRYVEEWLKGMTAAGYLEHTASSAGADTFRLSDELAYLIASEGTDHYMGGLPLAAVPMLRIVPQVAEAFRTGGGVPFSAFGADCVHALDVMNRGIYEERAAGAWLGAVPEAVTRLEAGGRALDVGCGSGRVAIALAKAYPKAEIVGLDPDAGSIRAAESAAHEAGLAGRPRFVAARTDTLERGDGFDLVTAFDCVHDFARPEATLREMRALLKPGGTLFVMEPKAGDSLAENCHALGTVYYGFSLFHCMTQSLAAGGPGLGTCMGPAKTMALIGAAGFRNVRQLDIRSQTNVFYAGEA
jgi:hypothetical protein